MDMIWWKIAILILLIIFSLIGLVIPKFVQACNSRVIGFANSFAGGIFLTIGMLHLLPEGAEKIGPEINEKFPLGFAVALAGYTLILFLDKVAFDSHALVSHGGKHTDLGEHSNQDPYEEEKRLKHVISVKQRMQTHLGQGTGETCEMICNNMTECLLNKPDCSFKKAKNEHSPEISHYIIAIALSVHGIFEGAAIGLQESVSDSIKTGAAVLAHKIPEAMALMISFNQTKLKKTLPFIVIFVAAGPLGLLIGIFFHEYTSQLVEAIVLCLSSGTFLYIAASEIIVEEFSVSHDKFLKFASFVLGIGLMISIQVLTESIEY